MPSVKVIKKEYYMSGPQSPKKLKSVLKAAALGGLLVAGLSLIILDTSSYYFVYLRFLVGSPGIFLGSILHLTARQLPTDVDAITFMVIVNGVIGALIFGGLAVLWQFLKNNHET